jgi:GntR family transcriptional regulator, arabinose operon transcriptional repressor
VAAKYIEIMKYLRDNYINNSSSQKKLPSEPQLSKLLGVSRFPINRAVTELDKKGEVSRFPGVGTYIKGFEPHSYRKKIQQSRTVVIVSFITQTNIFHGIQDVLFDKGVPFLNFFEKNRLSNLLEIDSLNSIVNTRSFGLAILPPLEFRSDACKDFKSLLKMAERNKLPAVVMERPCSESSCSQVTIDNSGGTAMAMEAMLRKGHRKIAYIGKDDYLVGKERAKGYFQALTDNFLLHDEDLTAFDRNGMTFMDNIKNFVTDSMNRILSKNPDCEAFMTFGISFALEVYIYLKKRGLFHENIIIGGYDQDHSQHKEFLQSYIALERPLFEIGRHSADTLLNMLNAEKNPGIILKKILPDMIMPHTNRIATAEEYL